jgi:hypothetical protein
MSPIKVIISSIHISYKQANTHRSYQYLTTGEEWGSGLGIAVVESSKRSISINSQTIWLKGRLHQAERSDRTNLKLLKNTLAICTTMMS